MNTTYEYVITVGPVTFSNMANRADALREARAERDALAALVRQHYRLPSRSRSKLIRVEMREVTRELDS